MSGVNLGLVDAPVDVLLLYPLRVAFGVSLCVVDLWQEHHLGCPPLVPLRSCPFSASFAASGAWGNSSWRVKVTAAVALEVISFAHLYDSSAFCDAGITVVASGEDVNKRILHDNLRAF